jgi:hypothetical protein
MNTERKNVACCYKILQAIGVLHTRGHQRLRIFPYSRMMWWRCAVAPGVLFEKHNGALLETRPEDERNGLIAEFGSANGCVPFGGEANITRLSSIHVADLFAEQFPALVKATVGSDWCYAGWYQEMLMRTSPLVLPMAFSSDEYESTCLDNLLLFSVFPTSNEPRREMPLPPLYKQNEGNELIGHHLSSLGPLTAD